MTDTGPLGSCGLAAAAAVEDTALQHGNRCEYLKNSIEQLLLLNSISYFVLLSSKYPNQEKEVFNQSHLISLLLPKIPNYALISTGVATFSTGEFEPATESDSVPVASM